jgi:hypothetical protein
MVYMLEAEIFLQQDIGIQLVIRMSYLECLEQYSQAGMMGKDDIWGNILERLRRGWEDNIKIKFREIYCECWRWMELTEMVGFILVLLNLWVLVYQNVTPSTKPFLFIQQ